MATVDVAAMTVEVAAKATRRVCSSVAAGNWSLVAVIEPRGPAGEPAVRGFPGGREGHGRAAWPLASRPRAKWSAATATASWPYPGLGRRPSYGDGPAAWPGGPGQVTCREAAYAPASC